MKMNQIVFVVYDSSREVLVGTYNEKYDAIRRALEWQDMVNYDPDDEEVIIIPSLVDTDTLVAPCLDESEVDYAVECLLAEAERLEDADEYEDEDEDEDEDEYEGEDDDYLSPEEEDEEDEDYYPDDEDEDEDTSALWICGHCSSIKSLNNGAFAPSPKIRCITSNFTPCISFQIVV